MCPLRMDGNFPRPSERLLDDLVLLTGPLPLERDSPERTAGKCSMYAIDTRVFEACCNPKIKFNIAEFRSLASAMVSVVKG